MNINRREAIKRTSLVMGGFLFTPVALSLLQGCKADSKDEWTPQFFTEPQAKLISELTETILPATDTPGAKDLGVPAFVEEMVHKVYSKDRQTLFIDGLEEFNEQAIQKSGREFADLDADQKHEFINDQNRKALKLEGDSFFLMAKELTMRGYFTTKVGATQVLKYEAIPGRYNACVPLENVGRTWAT